jgi:DNA-binding response OmpR family regulator
MHTILADDDPMMQSLLRLLLEQRGHEVVSVGDGVAAWEAHGRLHAPLIVLDWQMPGLDGIEVCRRIRASPSGDRTYVLLVTAREGADDLHAALDVGADDYLAKPMTPPQFWARVAIAERRIEQNQARWAAEAALDRSRWLAGVGATALAVQHEINNPLSALLTHTSLLAADPALGAAFAEDVQIIDEQARRIAHVVRRLAALDDPRTVEYLAGVPMLDLWAQPGVGR